MFRRNLENQRFIVVEFNSSLRKCMVFIIHWLTVTEICTTSFVFVTILVYACSTNDEGTYYLFGVPQSTSVVGFMLLNFQVLFLYSVCRLLFVLL